MGRLSILLFLTSLVIARRPEVIRFDATCIFSLSVLPTQVVVSIYGESNHTSLWSARLKKHV